MPFATSSNIPAAKSKSRPTPQLTSAFGSVYSVAEINAYIAIRDQLLAEAEEVRTQAKLSSAGLANDFVLGCLQPTRSPYEAQCLPEVDAAFERQRCEAVRNRIAQLRSRLIATPQHRD
jgi:hypothetical protein